MVDRQFADDSASLARSLVDYPFDTGVTFPFLSLSLPSWPGLHTLNSDVAAPVFFSLSLSPSLLFYGLIVAVCFRASVFSDSKSHSSGLRRRGGGEGEPEVTHRGLHRVFYEGGSSQI